MTAGRCARLGCDAPVTRQNRNGRGVRVNEGFSMGRIVRDLEVHRRDWTDAVLAGYFGRPLARAFSTAARFGRAAYARRNRSASFPCGITWRLICRKVVICRKVGARLRAIQRFSS